MGMKTRPPRLDRSTVKDLRWIRDQMDLGKRWKCSVDVTPVEADLILKATGEEAGDEQS